MKKLIIGYGKSGKAAAAFFLQKKQQVIAADQKAPEMAKQEGVTLVVDKVENVPFAEVEQVILSPGISPLHPLVKEATKRKIEVIGEIELAFRNLKNRAVGITGTNGKTTVTMLTAHILQQAGKPAFALGNVGNPLISFSGSEKDILVVELSSFQLETLQQKCLDVAIILNITPDHLDRYPSVVEYAGAKLRIQKALKDKGELFVNRDVAERYLAKGEYQLYDDRSNLKKRFATYLMGKKLPVNSENALAAYRLCAHFGVNDTQFMAGLKTFKAPPHRIEWAGEINGVTFYNDSKATNVESVIHAVHTLSGPIILIVGGLDKGSSYLPWIDVFKGKVKCLYAIGIAAKKIKQELESNFNVILADSLFDAVQRAYQVAVKKDQILLSPGCASFDSFRNYEHRGEEFKKFVGQIMNQGDSP